MSVQSVPVQHGQKVLKTKVRVIGRFLIKPDEDFNAMVARQLIDKAKQRHTRVTTELRVFDTGVQLGDHGVFASMPIEFVRYHRIADITVLTNEPTTLVICVKDYDQRCVTVMRLKDAVSVKVVTDVVDRHRTAYMEKFAKSSEFGSTNNRINLPLNSHTSNTAGGNVETRQFYGESRDYTDSAGGRAVNKSSEPDYAMIRRRNISPQKPASPPALTRQPNMRTPSGGGFFSKITVPAGPTIQESNNWSGQEQQRQSLHEQYQARRSQLLFAGETKKGGAEDMEMTAVFETRDGPPTLLNEPSRYVARVTDANTRSFDENDHPRQQRSPNDVSNWTLAQRAHIYAGGGAFRADQH